MTPLRAKPLRRVRHELFAFALVASVPTALALVFPYEAFSFRVERRADESRARCSFVTLTADEERAALAAARAAWQVDAKGVMGLRADLSTGDLPPEPMRPVIPVRPAEDRGVSGAVQYVPNALPPSVGACAAARIAPEGEQSAPAGTAFSREELLKID